MNISSFKASMIYFILALFINYFSINAQKNIFDSILNTYAQQPICIDVTRIHYSSLSNKTFTINANVYILNNKNKYRVICEGRFDAVKTGKHYGINDFADNIFVNYKYKDSTFNKREYEFLHDYMINQSTLKLKFDKNSNYLKSRINTKEYYILQLIDTIEKTTVDQIATFKSVIFTYYFSKKTFLLEKFVSAPIIEIGDQIIKDSTKFLFSYKKQNNKNINKIIEDFKPLKNSEIKNNFPENLNDTAKFFPFFTASDTAKNILNSNEIKTKLVLVEFWYKSCAPCIANMKELNKLKNSLKDKSIEIIALNIKDSLTHELKTKIESWKYSYKYLFSKSNELKKFKIYGYPTTVIYETNTNRILLNHLGANPDYSLKMFNFLNKELSE